MPVRFTRGLRVVLLATAALAGCGSPRVGVRRPHSSLLVAHLDASDAKAQWDQVMVRCYAVDGRTIQWPMRATSDGLLFVENIPEGSCWIRGGFEADGKTYVFKLPDDASRNPTAVAVTKPVMFLGAFKYESGAAGSFKLEPADEPSEDEALTSVLLGHAGGTEWGTLLKKKLRKKKKPAAPPEG
jgi:hypothetical protein